MKPLHTLLVAGVSVLAAGGVALAVNRIGERHVLTLALPDGSVEQIHYVGDAPPAVGVSTGPARVAVFQPFGFDPFDDPALDQLQRISAQMDREAAALVQLPMGLAATAGDPTIVALNGVPPGVSGYSVVSTLTPKGVCTRATRFGPGAPGQPEKVVSRVSGACGATPEAKSAATQPPGGVEADLQAHRSAPALIPTRF